MFEPDFFAERSISSLNDKFILPLRELREASKLIMISALRVSKTRLDYGRIRLNSVS